MTLQLSIPRNLVTYNSDSEDSLVAASNQMSQLNVSNDDVFTAATTPLNPVGLSEGDNAKGSPNSPEKIHDKSTEQATSPKTPLENKLNEPEPTTNSSLTSVNNKSTGSNSSKGKPKKVFPCTFADCDNSFDTERGLRMHMSRTHKKKK